MVEKGKADYAMDARRRPDIAVCIPFALSFVPGANCAGTNGKTGSTDSWDT
jgi:hypothetical protein